VCVCVGLWLIKKEVFAVEKLGYSGDNMARTLRISGRAVSDCRDRGEKILENSEIISEYLT